MNILIFNLHCKNIYSNRKQKIENRYFKFKNVLIQKLIFHTITVKNKCRLGDHKKLTQEIQK